MDTSICMAESLHFHQKLSQHCLLICYSFPDRAFLMSQKVKNLPAVWDTQVQPLGREDPLEKGMATHSSILAWRIPWTEDPEGLQSVGLQRVRYY